MALDAIAKTLAHLESEIKILNDVESDIAAREEKRKVIIAAQLPLDPAPQEPVTDVEAEPNSQVFQD